MTTSIKNELNEIFKNTNPVSFNEFITKSNENFYEPHIFTQDEDLDLYAVQYHNAEDLRNFVVKKNEDFFLIAENTEDEVVLQSIEDLDNEAEVYEAEVYESQEDADEDNAVEKNLTLQQLVMYAVRELLAITESNFEKVDKM